VFISRAFVTSDTISFLSSSVSIPGTVISIRVVLVEPLPLPLPVPVEPVVHPL